MPIGISSAKEPVPNVISSEQTDHTGINSAAILINHEAYSKRRIWLNRQAEGEITTFWAQWAVTEKVEEVVVFSCPILLLVKAKYK